MKDQERTYYESDYCRVLRNIKRFIEEEYILEESKRKEEENKLSNREKFSLYLSRMEKEFDRKHFYNNKNYIVETDDNVAIIKINDSNEEISIDFNNTSDRNYNEPYNSIFYKSNNCYYIIELVYYWGTCHIKHYKE